jgi:hypothetical protein
MSKKYALIIALEKYQHKNISPVLYAEKDAADIELALRDHGYLSEHLLSATATKTTIESRLRYYTGAIGKEDCFILFYAGHGFSENDHNYITCFDTQIGDLSSTSIPLQSIFKLLRDSKCQKNILLLDSCHSGLQIDPRMRGIFADMSEAELHDFFQGSDYNIGFASCKSHEKSYASTNLKHGIWSYHLINALKGNAPKILEKGRFLVASSLQNYLSQEVPRTIRKEFTTTTFQTPCLFGNLSRDFLVVDLEPIWAVKRSEAKPHLQQLKRIFFSREESGNIKSLSGFKKGFHRVPERITRATESFLSDISATEIKDEAENIFQRLKASLNYKRRDIELNYGDGSASIIAKDFDVDIFISQNSADPSEYVLQVELKNIRSPEIIVSDTLNKIFSREFDSLTFEFKDAIRIEDIIDKIEALDNDNISIDYPGDYDYCKISIEGLYSEIEITSSSFKIVNPAPTSPKKLLDSFFESQKLLIDNRKISLLPFSRKS